MMPEGIERDLTPQDLADVLAYLTDLKSTSNQPEGVPRELGEITELLLDDSQPIDRKQAVIDLRPGLGPAIVSQLASEIGRDDMEEYRRIPSIWRVAIAVGKRNDGGEIRDLLDVSLPREDEPLRDWQAVAIGGGIINGISQLGVWPDQRLAEVLVGVPDGPIRWRHAVKLASEMADAQNVRVGTRYDALRMIALAGWEKQGACLSRYITDEVPDELQMGAVSGLVDMQSAEAGKVLIERLGSLSPRNQQLAIEGMLRTEQRCLMLLDAISTGQIATDAVEPQRLMHHPSDKVRALASRLFAE
jgi:hypothetical protein